MSSLLIGIVGIILFIGLAISAAVFLGPKFEDAEVSAMASQVVATSSEVASATGSFMLASSYSSGPGLDVPALVSGGFLKGSPVNVEMPSRPVQIVGADGVDAAASASPATWAPRFVFMSLGTNRGLCTEVGRRIGAIRSGNQVSDQQRSILSFEAGNGGCFRSSVPGSGVAAGDYVAYVRI